MTAAALKVGEDYARRMIALKERGVMNETK